MSLGCLKISSLATFALLLRRSLWKASVESSRTLRSETYIYILILYIHSPLNLERDLFSFSSILVRPFLHCRSWFHSKFFALCTKERWFLSLSLPLSSEISTGVRSSAFSRSSSLCARDFIFGAAVLSFVTCAFVSLFRRFCQLVESVSVQWARFSKDFASRIVWLVFDESMGYSFKYWVSIVSVYEILKILLCVCRECNTREVWHNFLTRMSLELSVIFDAGTLVRLVVTIRTRSENKFS